MILFLDGFEMPRPDIGWSPVSIMPRVQIDPMQGGSAAHLAAGAIGDQLRSFSFPLLEATSAKTLLLADVTTGAAISGIHAEGLAAPVPVGVLTRSIAAVRVNLTKSATAGGSIAVEIWDGTGAVPTTKLGTLGVIDVDDISGGGIYGDIYVWNDACSFPIVSPAGWVVLNLHELTGAGATISWDAEDNGIDESAHFTAAAWAAQHGNPNMSVWQGGDALTLAGFVMSGSYPGGPGPSTRTLALDDGRQLLVLLHDLERRVKVKGYDRTAYAWWSNLKLLYTVISEIGLGDNL